MVVVEGRNVLHHVKRDGELSGREKYPGKYVLGKMPGSPCHGTCGIAAGCDPIADDCICL